MNSLDKQYQALLQDILDNGIQKKDRTGTGTLSVFGRQIRHKMSDGYPLLTTKKMAFKSIITELIWFTMGGTNIKFLVDNDCYIWVGDAYKKYLNYPLATISDHYTNLLYKNLDKGWCKINGRSMSYPHPTRYLTQEEFTEKIKTGDDFAKEFGELGKIYGYQWRRWHNATEPYGTPEGQEHVVTTDGNLVLWREDKYIDQIENLINELKNNPDSRRMMVSAWNVGELDEMVLPPCHYAFQVYTRELSAEERMDYWVKKKKPSREVVDAVEILSDMERHKEFNFIGIPTRAISLMFNMRSSDAFLGLPFNIASYGALLMMLADEMQMVPDELIGNLGDTHLYLNHIEQAKEQISREPFPLPTLTVEDGMYSRHVENFYLENYQSHPAIKAPLSN